MQKLYVEAFKIGETLEEAELLAKLELSRAVGEGIALRRAEYRKR